jgi:preprotein translocase subunit YajC
MIFETQAHAMAPQPPAAGGTDASAPNPLASFLPIIIIVGLFYFLLLRPQQRQQKERTAMINGVKADDKIVTVSGVYATVVKVNDDDTLILKISDNTNIKVTRQAIERLQK